MSNKHGLKHNIILYKLKMNKNLEIKRWIGVNR